MAVDIQDAGRVAAKARFWNDPQARGIIYQMLVLGGVALLGWYFIANAIDNLNRLNIASGYGFLNREAGFAISEGPISFTPADTYGRAFLVGLLNTLKVAGLGIVLATILGTLIGIARLSSNWLVAKIATVYVEVTRNIPLLLQLFVWQGIILITFPNPRQALAPVEGVFLSNRGITVPVPEAHPIWVWMGVALVVGVIGSVMLRRWAYRRQMATGQPFPTGRYSVALIVGLPLATWLVGGAPVAMSVPELRGFNFQGGATLSPEFSMVLLGLTFYTAAFIAEIVRAGIQAVSYGQTEAAAALGLRRGQVLRLVVLPQALRIIIPPTTSQYLNLAKNSSLAVYVGYPDLVSIGNTALNQTGQALEAISIFMAVYLLISLGISLAMNIYNRRIALVER